jgi:hypothetical protein
MQGRRQEIREQPLFRGDGCRIKPHQIKDNIPDDLEAACYFSILFGKNSTERRIAASSSAADYIDPLSTGTTDQPK